MEVAFDVAMVVVVDLWWCDFVDGYRILIIFRLGSAKETDWRGKH